MSTGSQGAPVTFALFYVVFTAVLVVSTRFTLETPLTADMHKACVHKYNTWPFNNDDGTTITTPRTVYDVRNANEIYLWLTKVFRPATYDEQVDSSTMFSNWQDKNITWDQDNSPATLSGLNRLLLFRMTFTRLQRGSSASSQFAKYTPDVLTQVEDREAICEVPGLPCYWSASGGFNNDGGYSIFVDPLKGPDQFTTVIEGMVVTGKVFTSALASFTVDTFVFNSQVKTFMQIAWRFECNRAGICGVSIEEKSSNYGVFTNSWSGWISFCAHIAQVPLTIILWVIELLKFDFSRCGARYLSNWGSLLDLISLTLCTVSLVFYWTMWFQSPWPDFDFSQLFDTATQEVTYGSIMDQIAHSQEFRLLASINVLVVFLRMVGVVAKLGTNFGLFLRVLEASFYNMVAFSIMFWLIIIGMVALLFFIFGSRAYQVSTLPRALYFLFSGLVGSPVYDILAESEPVMANLFYALFVIFYLTMLNVFISVLMSGYDIEVFKIDKKMKAGGIGDESLWAQFKREVHDILWKPVRPCFVCLWSCIGPCLKEFACCSPQDLLKSCCFARSQAPSSPDAVTAASGVSSFFDRSVTASRDGTVRSDASQLSFSTGVHSRDTLTRSSRRENRGQVDVAECVVVSLLMVAFLTFLKMQSRNMSAFEATQVTMISLDADLQWEAYDPYRMESYSSISTMAGVGRWATAACDVFYEESTCAVEKDGEYQWDSSGTSCNSSNETEQEIQRIGNWNIGFLSNVFVRMTVQPACYVKNEDSPWNEGTPLSLVTPDTECAHEDCQTLLNEESCKSAYGTSLSEEGRSDFDLADESVKYADPDTELGSHLLKGGFVFNLGNNRQQCKEMITTATEQNWFTQNAASIVFDWVTYNGNLDMFSTHTAAFSLMNTGMLKKDMSAVSFNMNYFAGGGPYYPVRIAILALFCLYALLVLLGISILLRDLVRVIRRRGETAWWKTWFSNIWNLTDTISLVLSCINIVNFSTFINLDFVRYYVFSLSESDKYAVPVEFEEQFHMANASDPARPLQDDYYYLYEFEQVRSRYYWFLIIGGFNSFFIAIKVVKYVGHVSSIRVFSETLWKGRERNFGFLVVLLLLMTGFALFIHLEFGSQVHEVRTTVMSLYTLFLCMLGQLDLEPYMKVNEPVALIFYCVYVVLFYFIAINMFLATMLNTYSEAEGNMGIERVKAEVSRERSSKRVVYNDVEDLMSDVRLELRKNEWVVANIYRNILGDEGPAATKGVKIGSRVDKINRQRLNKGDSHHRDASAMLNDFPPGRIVITFIDPQKQKSSGFFPKTAGKKSATVRGFWRHQGAVAWIADQEMAAVPQSDEIDESQLCSLLDDLSDSADNSDGDGDAVRRRASSGVPAAAPAEQNDPQEVDDATKQLQQNKEKEDVRDKLVKLRTKKRLDALLFSRWRRGGHHDQQVQFRDKAYRDLDGPASQADSAHDRSSAAEKDENHEAWSDQDTEDLLEQIDTEPTGPELWLDCLMGALEHEMQDDSVIAEVLRTSDMPTDEDRKSGRASTQASLSQLADHRKRVEVVLRILEFKSHKKYYHALQKESERRQRQLQSQNEVLHEYAFELEQEFKTLMANKAKLTDTKKGLLTKLAGLLAVPYDTTLPQSRQEQSHHHRHAQHQHFGSHNHFGRTASHS